METIAPPPRAPGARMLRALFPGQSSPQQPPRQHPHPYTPDDETAESGSETLASPSAAGASSFAMPRPALNASSIRPRVRRQSVAAASALQAGLVALDSQDDALDDRYSPLFQPFRSTPERPGRDAARPVWWLGFALVVGTLFQFVIFLLWLLHGGISSESGLNTLRTLVAYSALWHIPNLAVLTAALRAIARPTKLLSGLCTGCRTDKDESRCQMADCLECRRRLASYLKFNAWKIDRIDVGLTILISLSALAIAGAWLAYQLHVHSNRYSTGGYAAFLAAGEVSQFIVATMSTLFEISMFRRIHHCLSCLMEPLMQPIRAPRRGAVWRPFHADANREASIVPDDAVRLSVHDRAANNSFARRSASLSFRVPREHLLLRHSSVGPLSGRVLHPDRISLRAEEVDEELAEVDQALQLELEAVAAIAGSRGGNALEMAAVPIRHSTGASTTAAVGVSPSVSPLVAPQPAPPKLVPDDISPDTDSSGLLLVWTAVYDDVHRAFTAAMPLVSAFLGTTLALLLMFCVHASIGLIASASSDLSVAVQWYKRVRFIGLVFLLYYLLLVLLQVNERAALFRDVRIPLLAGAAHEKAGFIAYMQLRPLQVTVLGVPITKKLIQAYLLAGLLALAGALARDILALANSGWF